MVATTVQEVTAAASATMHRCISATDRLLLEFLRTHETTWEAAAEASCRGAVVLQPKLRGLLYLEPTARRKATVAIELKIAVKPSTNTTVDANAA